MLQLNMREKGKMTMKQIGLCGMALLAAATAFAGKAASCADVPLSMTFVATTAAPAAIWNDVANMAYQNGVSGVGAVIQLNSTCGGTHDATLSLGGSKRSLWMQYPSAIPGSIVQAGPASFAGASAFTTQAHVNIHNITGYTVLSPGVAATFSPRPGPNSRDRMGRHTNYGSSLTPSHAP